MSNAIYIRVSTTPQAYGSGLVRQLEECTRYASRHRLTIGAVFCDIKSGCGDLPQRDAAMAFAKKRRGFVLVEELGRWSRAGNDGSEASEFSLSGKVIQCSDAAIELDEKIYAILNGGAT